MHNNRNPRLVKAGLCLTLVLAAIPGAKSAPVPAPDSVGGLPFRNIHVAGSAPKIDKTAQTFVVRNPGKIKADIIAPVDAYLCRLEPEDGNAAVVQLSVGKVSSSRCNALFSPLEDWAIEFVASRVALQRRAGHYMLEAEGPLTVRVHPDFMKKDRGLNWYRPIEKTPFKRAPCGWCSWYVYYQGVTEEATVKSTDWLAKHFTRFGCEYVQIDDGWQGVGHGSGENRDWAVTAREKFPHGMGWLARYIRSKGLQPGIWLIPFATSNEETFKKHPELFIRRPDGTSIGESIDGKTGKKTVDWTGRFIVDPTSDSGQKWFRDLFGTICGDWGYDYVKIDGQGGSMGACRRWHDRLANPKLAPDVAYRMGLEAIKSVMGPERFLLNCGGQYDSCGYCEGIRIGGDVGPSWTRMQPAISSTMAHLYLNHNAFWTDPDVVCVRPKGNHGSTLTLDQARVWATLYGITGQLLMASDVMPELPPERLELFKRIFPPADIRPMELYPLRGRPPIFDLRIAKPGVGQWDIVAVFNWSAIDSTQIVLSPAALGLSNTAAFLYYDAWQKQLLAVGRDRLVLALPPTSCRVICLRPLQSHPQIVGTSRHITQGADDLIEANWDSSAGAWTGRSAIVGGDPYEIRFTLPPGWAPADKALQVHGRLAVLKVASPGNAQVTWRAKFAKTAVVPKQPRVLSAKLDPHDLGIRLSWTGKNALSYRILRNGKTLTQTAATTFDDLSARRGVKYQYAVVALGWNRASAPVVAGEATLEPLPRRREKDAWIDNLAPLTMTQEWGKLHRGRSVENHVLTIKEKVYKHGLGTHARSEVIYRLRNGYSRIEGEVGVDFEKGGLGSVLFQVIADGKKLFDSGVMKGTDPARKFSVSLEGVDILLLRVTDGGDGINCDHADWADVRLIGNR